jgi:hypothetical protein
MMLARVDIQKEIYEGRLKARRDEQMRLTDTLAEGLAKGVLIGRIEFAQKLMRREVTPRAALEAMPLEALEALAAQLERELLG